MNLYLYVTLALLVLGIAMGKDSSKNKDPSKVIKQDLPYIKCEVCEHVMAALIPAVEQLKDDHRAVIKKKPIGEVQVLEVIENVCNPKNDSGLWIRRLDIVERPLQKKKYLGLAEPGGISKCKSECLTIAKSCEDMFENEIEIDDLSALLWKKSLTIDEAQEKICRKQTKRCGEFPKELSPNYQRVDYPFEAMPEKEFEMEKMMASMKEMGLGSSLYSRDDMENMMMNGGMPGMGGMDGYEDDEDFMSQYGEMGLSGQGDESEDSSDIEL